MTAASDRLPDIDLGPVAFRFITGPLGYRPWAAMQQRITRPAVRKSGWKRLAVLWLAIFSAALAALLAEDRWLGLDGSLALMATRRDGWFTQFDGTGLAALALGLPLAGIAALIVAMMIYREPAMRRLHGSFAAFRQPSELLLGEKGLAQRSATGTVLFARWPTVADEFVAEGVLFIRLDMGAALYVDEATLGDQRAAAIAFVRGRMASGAPATAGAIG